MKYLAHVMFLVLAFSTLYAQESAEKLEFAVDADVGIVDQVVSVTFIPNQVFMLLESKLGGVWQYPGSLTAYSPDSNVAATENRFLVGARSK